MPPPINPSLARIFIEQLKNIARQIAKEVAKAADKELAVEFVEELAKEIAQRIAKELLRFFPDMFKGPTPKEENADGWTGDGAKLDEKVMDQGEKSIDDIISTILFGEGSYEPQQSIAQVQDEDAEIAQLPPEVLAIEIDSDKEEPPMHDERVINLCKEMESLQKEWMALTLAHATESPSENAQSTWCWKWIIIGGIVLVVLVGGAVYLWYRWHGGSHGGGNADNGGAGADRANAEEHLAGQAGLQILLYGSGPPSGPLVHRRLVTVDGLVLAGSGTRIVPASHPTSPALPTAQLSEVAVVVASLMDEFDELVSNLSEDKEGNIIMKEDILKLCKTEEVTELALPVGSILCV